MGNGCQCKPCHEQRAKIAKREKGSLFAPNLSKRCVESILPLIYIEDAYMRCRTYFLIAGWSLFAFLCYKVAGATIENKVYNPFEILGISAVSH